MIFSKYILKFLAKRQYKLSQLSEKNSVIDQWRVFKKIIELGKGSKFAKDHNLNGLSYKEYKKKIPLFDYEKLAPYISLISAGEKNILTKGSPMYFAVTSGTTSGTKYIPLTKNMLASQTRSVKELLLLYSHQTGQYDFSGSAMMFIQGSPKLSRFNKIPYAKLSGITARHIPFYLKKNRLPTMKTNLIKDWDLKLSKIVEETIGKDLKILGGIPPWVITYFEKLLQTTNKKRVLDVFPNLKLYIHGGTSFDNYKSNFLNMCGDIDTLEVYPASEGFFGYQNKINDSDLLLLTNHGVFYEFIELSEFKCNNFERRCLEDVQVGIDYVMIVSTISGLWGYNTGDTIRFTSLKPYRFVFSGRASQFCSAFGEHVIEKEVQTALKNCVLELGGVVSEFTVCPDFGDDSKKPCHNWYVEFGNKPNKVEAFELMLNKEMEKQNPYYKDLIHSGVIGRLELYCVKRGGFNSYMKSIGKFGGQNKCPHLSNNNKIGSFLKKNYV